MPVLKQKPAIKVKKLKLSLMPRGKPKKKRTGHSETFLTRIAPILERTKASQRQLQVGDVDMGELAALPVIIRGKLRPGKKRRWRNKISDE